MMRPLTGSPLCHLVVAGLLLAAAPVAMAPGRAQTAPAAAPDAPLPADPAATPPPPVDLNRAPLPPPPPPPPSISALPLPAGMERRPDGAWRIQTPESTPLSDPLAAALAELGQRLAAMPQGRVTVIAQAAGPANDASIARRRSLERGRQVKAALVRGGLADTRIDIRPMGRTDEGIDAVDVLPPDAPRPTRPAQ